MKHDVVFVERKRGVDMKCQGKMIAIGVTKRKEESGIWKACSHLCEETHGIFVCTETGKFPKDAR